MALRYEPTWESVTTHQVPGWFEGAKLGVFVHWGLYSVPGWAPRVQTTVAEIAKRAGLTERTFFRHFADKREVLFWGSDALRELLVDTVVSAPDSVAPIDAVTAALQATGGLFEEHRERARKRQAVIAANPELQERELMKLASLATAMAGALRRRGVRDPAASLTAEAGIAVFRIAFERWIDESNQPDFSRLVRESLDDLRVVTAGRPPRAAGRARRRAGSRATSAAQ